MANPFVAQPGAGIDRLPDPRSPWTTGANLLVATLLLAGAVPFNNARAQPITVWHPSHTLCVNADTSRGVPKTLTTDSARAFFVAPNFAPQHPVNLRTPNPDTSRGIAKALFPDAANAFFVPPHFSAQHPGGLRTLHQDTSESTAKTLYPDSVQPTFNAPRRQIPSRPALLADTSKGMAQPLSAVAPTPVFNPPWRQIQSAPVLLADTSRGVPSTLTAATPAPTFNAQFLAPLLRLATTDTSQSTPKVLYADAVSPFFNPPQVTPDRVRPVADTSGFLNPPGTPVTNPPSFSVVALPVPVSDTSLSTPKALFADDATPAFNPSHLRLDWPGQVTDTSQGVAQALLPVPPPPEATPFTNTFLAPLAPPVLGPDTSYGTPEVLLPVIVKKVVYGGKEHLNRVRIERDNEELMAIAALIAPLLEGKWLL